VQSIFYTEIENLAQGVGVPLEVIKGDPVATIKMIRASNPAIIQSLLPGEEKMNGVMSGIDAVGYQARDRKNPSKENPAQVISDLIRLVNPTDHLGIIGVYMADDPGGVTEHAKK